MLPWLSSARLSRTSALDARGTAPFYASDGSVLWTIRDLADALVRFDEATFTHHVSGEHNDFANWVEHCFVGAAQQLGSALRGKSREDMVRLFVAKSQGKPAPVSHEHALTPAAEHRPALVLPPAKTTVAPTTLHPHPAARPHAHHEEELELHPKPLPDSPLQVVHHRRLKAVQEELGSIRLRAATDSIAAKESFIELRTRVWRDFDEEERKQIVPQLREAYEFLLRVK